MTIAEAAAKVLQQGTLKKRDRKQFNEAMDGLADYKPKLKQQVKLKQK